MELVKIRASQINGCAFCLEMHTREARKGGESEARIYLLDAWHESPLYSPRERAALAWTDALPRLSEAPPADTTYDELKVHFTEEEIVRLTLLIVAINGWNRVNVGFRAVHPIRAADRPAA
jgi:AhpD family alkylhydroperoxidase